MANEKFKLEGIMCLRANVRYLHTEDQKHIYARTQTHFSRVKLTLIKKLASENDCRYEQVQWRR